MAEKRGGESDECQYRVDEALEIDMAIEVEEQKPGLASQSRASVDPRRASEMRFRFGLCILVGLFVFSIILAVAIGTVGIPSRSMISMLLNHAGVAHFPETWPTSDETIILQIRLPRVLAAALVGANPDADCAAWIGVARMVLNTDTFTSRE